MPQLAQQFLRRVASHSGLRVLTDLLREGVDALPDGLLRVTAELARSTKATSAEMAARAAGHKRGRDFIELSSGAPMAPSGSDKSAHQDRGAARLQHIRQSAKRGPHWVPSSRELGFMQ